MRASLLFVAGALAGALAGGAGTYLTLHQEASTPSARNAEPGDPPPLPSPRPSVGFDDAAQEADPTPISIGDRLALYEYAASVPDASELELLIHRAAALPPSHRRSFELDALLARLAEDDAARAVRLARSLRLETEFLAPLFQLWAERDPRAALDELRRIDNPAAVRTLALALLDVFGDDERGIARLEPVLSQAQMHAFRIDAVVRLASRDPFVALERALALPDSAARSAALSRIATEWARQDPAAALAQVDAIDDEQLRAAYEGAVIGEWARLDPDAVFAYWRSQTSLGAFTAAGLPAIQTVAAVDPDGLLALADELPFEVRTFARQFAFQALAERDPNAAIAALESITTLSERNQLVATIARAYAQRDPEHALQWAESLPDSINAVGAVLSVIARTDPERAIELALAEDRQMDPMSSLLLVNVVGTLRDSRLISAFAERLLDRTDFRSTQAIGMLLTGWSMRDPNAALDWVVENADRVDRGTLAPIAAQLASRDPEAAIRALDRLPPEMRGDWLAQVAGSYAEYDPEAAVTWVMQYRGQPGFDQAVASVAQRTARSDPQAAIRLIERLGQTIDQPTAVQIAATWASQDPAAAAEWTLRLPDAVRSTTIGVVASTWSSRDPNAAKRWALNLPSGELRDQALGAILPMTLMTEGSVDPTIMDSFSSDAARQNAVLRGIAPLASRNRQEAERIVDTYITDPTVREQAEAMMSRGIAVGIPATSVFAPGNAIRIR